MVDRFCVMIVQVNLIMGDLVGNVVKVKVVWDVGKLVGFDFVVLFEMFIFGYNVQDLVMKFVLQVVCFD